MVQYDKQIYHLAKILRSHGLAREIGDNKIEKQVIKKNPQLSPQFIFLYPAYNMRNTEVGAVIGLNQLKSLDRNNKKRKNNLRVFLENLDRNKYIIDFDTRGSCNYAFPIVLKKPNFKHWEILAKTLKKNRIEFRKGNAGGGNQLRQPYLKSFKKKINLKNFKEVDHIHFFSCYIGNYPSLRPSKVRIICSILNSIKYDI